MNMCMDISLMCCPCFGEQAIPAAVRAFCILTSNAQLFQSLHILTNTCYFLLLNFLPFLLILMSAKWDLVAFLHFLNK